MRYTAVSIAVFVGLAFMGCAPSDPPTAQTDAVSSNDQTVAEEQVAEAVDVVNERTPEPEELVGSWLLEDLGGRRVVDTAQTTLEFDGEGRIGGNAGCNNYMGEYSFEEGALGFPAAFAATKMMCPPPLMEQEDAFLQALAGFEHATISDDTLKVFFADSDEPLVFSRVVAEEAEH